MPASCNGCSGLFSTLNGITAALSNEKIALINATTDREKAEIQERISALQATQAVLIAESAKCNIPMLVQLGMTLPVMIIMAKVLL